MKPFHRILLLIGLTGSAITGSAEAEWPQFRGPTGQGIASATNVPVHWSATSNVVWETAIPGRGWSSPVLAAGRVYLTAAVDGANGAPASLCALCVNATDGAILWNVEVRQPEPASAKTIHQKNSAASPTPIIDRGRLYVPFGHMGTAALDLSGKILWRQTALKYSPLHGNGGSPVLLGDTLVFSCDGTKDPFIVALDAGTGGIRWKTPRQIQRKRVATKIPLLTGRGGGRWRGPERSRRLRPGFSNVNSGGEHAHTPDASRGSELSGGRQASGVRVALAPLR